MNEKKPINLRQKRTVDILMLILCPATILLSILIGQLEQSGDPIRQYAWLALIIELGLFYYCARLYMEHNGGKARFGFVRISLREAIFSLVLGTALFYLVTALSSLMQLVYQELGISLTGTSLGPLSGWRFFAGILLIAVIPAIAEETLFRGALLHAWLPVSAKKAIWHSALLFALIHIQPLSLPFFLPMGLLFAYLSLKTGSVYNSIGLHMGYNLMVLFYSVLAAEVASSAPAEETLLTLELLLPGLIRFLFFGLTLGFLSLRGLLRASQKRQTELSEAAKQWVEAVKNAVSKSGIIEKIEQRRKEHPAKSEPGEANASQEEAPTPKGKSTLVAIVCTYALLIGLNVFVLVQLFVL